MCRCSRQVEAHVRVEQSVRGAGLVPAGDRALRASPLSGQNAGQRNAVARSRSAGTRTGRVHGPNHADTSADGGVRRADHGCGWPDRAAARSVDQGAQRDDRVANWASVACSGWNRDDMVSDIACMRPDGSLSGRAAAVRDQAVDGNAADRRCNRSDRRCTARGRGVQPVGPTSATARTTVVLRRAAVPNARTVRRNGLTGDVDSIGTAMHGPGPRLTGAGTPQDRTRTADASPWATMQWARTAMASTGTALPWPRVIWRMGRRDRLFPGTLT